MARHPKPTIEANAGRLVRKAADVLEDRDWVRGMLGTADGGMCFVGAVQFTATGNPVRHNQDTGTAVHLFGFWLQENGFCQNDSAMWWNDKDAVDKAEVLQVMRKFADEKDPQR